MKKTVIISAIMSSILMGGGAVNLDDGQGNAQLKLDRANVLNFPFIVKSASVASENQDEYQVKSINNTIVVIPTGELRDVSDLIVTSSDRETFIISLSNQGSEQVFNFTYGGFSSLNKHKTSKFESNKLDSDIVKLMKSVLVKEHIQGYTKVLINKKVSVKNMELQKNNIYNGSKYRVEEWFIKNTSGKQLIIDEATFYTKGILAINLEQRRLAPDEVIKMVLVLNKIELKEKSGE